MGSRTWFKVFSDNWISGTLREETPGIRGVWIDLLALACSGQYGDTGEIKLSNGVGFTDSQIADILHISKTLCRRARQRFLETDRIEISPRGAIRIVNWSKYQSEYRRQKAYRKPKDEEKSDSSMTERNSPLTIPLENEKEKESEKLQREVTSNGYNKDETISLRDGMSLSHYAPKGKAEANSLTNGLSVLPGEDRATLESDPSALGSPSRGTYRQRIEQYLKVNGLASLKEIRRATGIDYTMVAVTLNNGKNKVFKHLKEQRVWGLINP